jgi:hypothetical protein
MNAQVRRKLDMAARVIAFSRENPDESDPGHAAAVTHLEELVARAESTAQVQREGVVKVRTSTVTRRELRRSILQSHVTHLAGVAELAARDHPDATRWFVLGSGRNRFGVFLTAVHTMLERAESQRELLLRYGLSPKVLDDLRARLAEFDAVTAESREGRRRHVLARGELDRIAAEAFDVVKVLDGFNRMRFGRDPAKLGEWESVSGVEARPQRGAEEAPAPPVGGSEKAA